MLSFFLLLFVRAPYGRHARSGWGVRIDPRLGWLVMESASPLALAFFFFYKNSSLTPVETLFVCLWLLHYINRAFIYPFRLSRGSKGMPLSVAAMAIFFNSVNGYLNGVYLNRAGYALHWLADPRFIAGMILFGAGAAINLRSDAALRGLRSGADEGYRIPRGGLFRYVSCANYLGEIVEWSGWACMTWSVPGLSFAFWTACNLIPRALAHHRWYRETFPAYPPRRKAVIPFLI
jgi:3-oxo-5-alpha-steroid 4-dehydrogenase 1